MDVKELSDMILGNFRSRLAADSAAQHIIKNGSKMTDLPRLSQILGRYLTAAVESSIKDYPFPFGTDEMQQIAEDILDPIMRESCKLLDDVFIKIQRQTDKKNGINFEPVLSKYQATRAKQIYLSAADPLAKKETILRRLSVPPATLVNNHVDHTMQSNAKVRNEAGFETYIIRTDNGKCCPWCAKITGRYSYPDKTPKDIFRRHDNCGCTVVYECGNMRQDVHSKRTWEQASVNEQELVRNPDVTVPELVRNPKVEVPELKRGLLTEGENGGIMRSEDGSKIALPTIVDKVSKLNYFENDDLNNAVTDAANNLLSSAKKHALGTELGYIIDFEPPYTLSPQIIGGEGEMAIYIPHSKKTSVTLHNHPSGSTFSGKDIDNFIKDTNAKAMCVIGNNGKWYVLEKRSSFDWIDFGLKTLSFSQLDDYVQKILEEASVYGFNYYKS